MSELMIKAKTVKEAAREIAKSTTKEKNEALQAISEGLRNNIAYIIEENNKDIENGRNNGLHESLIDRLVLNEERINDMADALIQLTELNDPIGSVIEEWDRPNGLKISKVRVPIGVIGIIYEARPNVTINAASLSLKTSNAVLLRGSSSAIHSNKALVKVIHEALKDTNVPANAVQILEDTSRETAAKMFQLNDYLDVLIPRGGQKLIKTVVENSSIPVLETGAGNCHLYIDESANKEMAIKVAINAKTQRPSVCNSIETILINENWAEKYGVELLHELQKVDVEIHGDDWSVEQGENIIPATEEDYKTEYLDKIVAIKTVSSVNEAIDHINQYGTSHSEAIITDNDEHASQFLNEVDAAAVYHNASTRFTDGFEFGFGAEIGISTQKLHARGPMGLEALTSMKYQLHGTGQIK
mgnify:CR=1 FL=1